MFQEGHLRRDGDLVRRGVEEYMRLVWMKEWSLFVRRFRG